MSSWQLCFVYYNYFVKEQQFQQFGGASSLDIFAHIVLIDVIIRAFKIS